VPRIFWLYGQAGRGKSAITRTIALQYKNVRGIYSFAQLLYSANPECTPYYLHYPQTIHFLPVTLKQAAMQHFSLRWPNVCLEATRSVVVPQLDRAVVGSRQNVF